MNNLRLHQGKRYERVTRAAEEGDLIEITRASAFYCVGDVGRVIRGDRSGTIGVDFNGFNNPSVIHDGKWAVNVGEFVVLEPAAEIGDRIKVESIFSQRYLGDDYRVIKEEELDSDSVNHPNHYTVGKFETIEIIEEITKGYEDGYVAYCVGNAIKYLSRAPFKHDDGGLEDLSKAAKYLEFATEYLEEVNE